MSRRTVQLAAAQTLLVDGLEGETFYIHMGTSIRHLQVINLSPGQLYVFVLTQDNAGGRTVSWAPQALNATQLDPRPHSQTVITFIAQAVNLLNTNLGGAWAGTNTQLQQEGQRRWRPRRLAQSPPSE